ncbi:MAG: hypothetical protein ACK4VV_10245 [Pseudomonas sp.]
MPKLVMTSALKPLLLALVVASAAWVGSARPLELPQQPVVLAPVPASPL